MNWIPLLLSDSSPNLRLLVLRELLNQKDDDLEVQELQHHREDDHLVSRILKSQNPDGSWNMDSVGTIAPGGNLQTTSQILVRLGYLGFNKDHPSVQDAVEYIFSKQKSDGSWPLSKYANLDGLKGYDMQPLQTIVPLEGIAASGHATDTRAENAYEWLIEQKLDDGAWPVGIASGVYGGIAGYRRISHSRWGCRSTTIGVLNCFSYHPKRKNSSVAQRALDLILGCETKDKYNLGFVISRLIGLEMSRGWITYYPRLDPAHILNLCWKIGASSVDERVDELITFAKELQGEFGLWECPLHPQASRFLTFDLLRSLKNLVSNDEWINLEPRTPFQAYPKNKKRF
jgi:hypothetical protein